MLLFLEVDRMGGGSGMRDESNTINTTHTNQQQELQINSTHVALLITATR